MSEWRVFVQLLRSPRSDILVLVVTFLLTVLIDLTVALQAGMVLAAFLFMGRMANLAKAGYVTPNLGADNGEDDPDAAAARNHPAGVEIFEVQGAFFFGAASKFKDALSEVDRRPKVLILSLREVPAIDATALRAPKPSATEPRWCCPVPKANRGSCSNGPACSIASGVRTSARKSRRRSNVLASCCRQRPQRHRPVLRRCPAISSNRATAVNPEPVFRTLRG